MIGELEIGDGGEDIRIYKGQPSNLSGVEVFLNFFMARNGP